jgi:hypothetical protein
MIVATVQRPPPQSAIFDVAQPAVSNNRQMLGFSYTRPQPAVPMRLQFARLNPSFLAQEILFRSASRQIPGRHIVAVESTAGVAVSRCSAPTVRGTVRV